jgi:hypothetical protein
VSLYGPAVVGTNWYEGMFEPASGGHLIPVGQLAGGHAYRVVQANRTVNAYRVVNSWGFAWGVSGRAWLTRSRMASLLAEQGEAATIAP